MLGTYPPPLSPLITDSFLLTVPLWAAGNDTAAGTDACSELPADTPDLSETVVLLGIPTSGGECTTEIQAANVAAKGGQYVLWYAQDNT